jgi:anti-sigma factor RsiW
MECNKFEERGLLYAAGELGPAEACDYEAHLAVCGACRGETEAYRRERAEIYTADILSERPSPGADAEILRRCSNARKKPAAFAKFMFINIKKYAPLPVFLMLIMALVGGYLSYHAMTADKLRAKYDSGGVAGAKIAALPEKAAAEDFALSDSTAAAADTAAPVPGTRGNMALEGVVTVKGGGN